MKSTLHKLILILGLAATLPAFADNPKVLMETSLGNVTLELDAEKAPKSVENFLKYVDDGYYDGTVFHRVIDGFMVQGGGFTPDIEKKPGIRDPIDNEADNGLKNLRGTLAMARKTQPHSATAQFYINLVDNGFLDFRQKNRSGWGYAVFGKVTDGMDVVDAIAKLPTTTRANGMANVPIEPPVIKHMSRIDTGTEAK